jgi:hypothetical protein
MRGRGSLRDRTHSILAPKRDTEPSKCTDNLHPAGTALVTKELAKGAIPLRVCQGLLALPVQRTFFDSVNESDHQDHHEPQHAAKNGPRIEFVDVVPVDHSPRVHKHNLDIE